MSRGVSTLLVILALSPQLAAAADGVWIKLKPDAEITTARYRLGDVATVVSNDADLAAELKAFEIGVAPRMGYTSTAERASFEKQVRIHYPDFYQRMYWSGSKTVTLRSRGESHDMQPYLERAQQALLQYLGGLDATVTGVDPATVSYEVKPAVRSAPLQLPFGKVDFGVRVTQQTTLTSRMCVWVDVSVDGAAYRSVPTWFAVKALAPVFVMKRDTRARTPITRRDVDTERRDIAALGYVPLSSYDPLDAVWLTRNRIAADVLGVGDIAGIPSVMQEQKVAVVVDSGPVRIETVGVAESDGYVGDLIRVQNPRGADTYLAKVIGKGRVYVQ